MQQPKAFVGPGRNVSLFILPLKLNMREMCCLILCGRLAIEMESVERLSWGGGGEIYLVEADSAFFFADNFVQLFEEEQEQSCIILEKQQT